MSISLWQSEIGSTVGSMQSPNNTITCITNTINNNNNIINGNNSDSNGDNSNGNNDIIDDNTIAVPVPAITANTAIAPTQPSVQLSTLSNSKPMPQAVLICRKNSHPFVERRIYLDGEAKVGRAVARSKPSNDNYIFDCKVLSRNHALLWFENQKFYLKDTRSSNGTFINNQRLSPANEESVPREVFSGDVVQFGVDVMENTRKVTHGCIIATIRLFYADGTEAKAQEQPNSPQSTNQSNVGITSQQLYELSQYLNEALHREQILENKLETLERVVTNAQESSNGGWKSLVEEDRLLSRIETLQNKLEVCFNSTPNNNKESNKESADSTDGSSVQNIKEEMIKLIDDKEKYESAAKEAIQKALEEKLIVLTRLHELEVSAKSHEEECNRLQEVCETSAQEINRLANDNDELNKEIESYMKRLKAFEDQKIALIEATTKEREELEDIISKLKAKESENNETISQLRALNESANLQIESLRLQFDVIKESEKVRNDSITNDNNNVSNESFDKSDNTYKNEFKVNLDEELLKVKKQLELSNNRCIELSAELNGLKCQTESTVTLTESVNSASIFESKPSALINGEILSTNDISIDESVITADVKAQHSAPADQTTSQLSSEIDLLKELLAETRASKKSIEEELTRSLTELENLRSLTKQLSVESDETQENLEKTLKELEEKNVSINSLKNQIKELSEKMRICMKDSEAIKCKISENERLIQLKDDELNSLRVLLDEERKVQQKYATNYEQCRKQLSETQLAIKQSHTETELLRKKVYSVNEELRSSRSNLSISSTSDSDSIKLVKEYEKLQNESHSLKSRLNSREAELQTYRTEHQKLSADYQCLQKSFELLKQINTELEQRGDNYWKEQFNAAQTQALSHQTKLIDVSKDLEEFKEKFETSSKDNAALYEDLNSAKEEIEIFSYQNKIATACAVIPLFMLLIAVLMAYYPSVSTVTGTTDL